MTRSEQYIGRKLAIKKSKSGLLALSFGALGVVFGDIGTSPLYAINEIFLTHAHPEINRLSVLSLISLVLWALILVVAFKYVTWVLRADNEGEGGVFALFALLRGHRQRLVKVASVLLIVAAGLLFGDGIITPAISVLSAVEGLKVITPSLSSFVIPITIGILTGLFAIQSRGTHKIGKLFGPIILVWFICLAALGLNQIVRTPDIFNALNPYNALHALQIFPAQQLLFILGGVMLVVTGGEALFADMGHFGRGPIRLSWFSVVMPALMLNYMGQGAFLLSGQAIVGDNIFYSLVPSALLVPMVILATMATIIASQALISGVFSLTSQGIALGLMPRLKIQHTHEEHSGQIYISLINWALYVGCIALVITFKSSSNLASAYGLAVACDMVITSLSMALIARRQWKWALASCLALFVPLLTIDFMFLSANSLKFFEGGFVPITIGLVLFTVMTTWRWGKQRWLTTLQSHSTLTMQQVLAMKNNQETPMQRSLLVLTNTTATELSDPAPALLELFIKRYHHLPNHIIALTVKQIRKPYVSEEERYEVVEFQNDHDKSQSLLSIRANFGFMETPDVERVVKDIADNETLTPNDDMKDWILYVARERVIARKTAKLRTRLRGVLYSVLINNSTPAYEYYGLSEDSRLNAELVPTVVA